MAPTLVEITQALTEANEALVTAVGAAIEAKVEFDSANETLISAQTALADAKAAHAAALAQIEELT